MLGEGREMIEEKSILGLSTIRRNRGISLEQIAESTKISIRSLEAIEQGDFRKLPGGIYDTSYIRQYARAIEYDESALIAFYKGEMARSEGASRNGSNGNGGYGGLRPASSIMGS
jgi:cytoskeletal protein RodZ